ncbi:unnamed protein product, partial [Trichogramma brassicae]
MGLRRSPPCQEFMGHGGSDIFMFTSDLKVRCSSPQQSRFFLVARSGRFTIILQ